MLFCSREFAAFFFAVLVLYWAVPHPRLRVWGLVVASIAFYASWSRWLTFVVCASTTVDFVIGRMLATPRSDAARKALVGASVIANLTLLATFKYLDFGLESLAALLHALGAHAELPLLRLVVPIGISFYTFEAISYTVDVYRGRIAAEQRIENLLLFVLFFPHLVAGPIVRARQFLPQVRRPKTWSWSRAELGLRYWISGLAKKLMIADRMAWTVDPVFADPNAYATHVVWLAVFAYAIQLYCDFSGYSDMAIGSAHLLGFKLPRNFDLPYLASGPSDFWRRWHVSLSTWLRDYLYVPLGGNTGGRRKEYRNLVVTMTLGGLWHGAAARFVIWGFLHGLLLVAEREIRRITGSSRAAPSRVAALVGGVATFVSWSVLLTFFRSSSGEVASRMLLRMLVPASGLGDPMPDINLYCTFAIVAGAHIWAARTSPRTWFVRRPVATGLAYACALSVVMVFSADAGRAFIYFQF